MELLDKLKILLGADDSKAPLLSLLIEEAKEDAIAYCNLKEYNPKMDSIILKMVRYKYTKLGNEAISSTSYSGISESYRADYTNDIYKALNNFRKVKCLWV